MDRSALDERKRGASELRLGWCATWALLIQLQLLGLFAKDLFVSSQDPYPYTQFCFLTAALVTGVVAGSNTVRGFEWVADVGTVLGIAASGFDTVPLVALLACIPAARLAGPQPKWRRIADIGLVLLCLADASRAAPIVGALIVACVSTFGISFAWNRVSRLRPWGVWLVALAICLPWLFGAASGWRVKADWLVGSGLLGTESAAPGGPTIAGSLGLPVLCLATIGSAVLLILVAVATSATPPPAERRPLIAAAIGMLGALGCLNLVAPAFLLSGTFGGTLVFALALGSFSVRSRRPLAAKSKRRTTRRTKLARACLVVALLLALGLSWLPAKLEVDHFLATPPTPNFAKIDAVSPSFLDCTVAMEDGRFYSHHGFDLGSIHRALRTDIREGRVVQGGSTITQQLAKNQFLEPDRTWWRKVKEAFLTLELERRMTKREILEAYVNTIDYGSDCHGIRQAAAHYFHKRPGELTLSESATLVGLVPDPPKGDARLDLAEIGRSTALGRLDYFFPGRYSMEEIGRARETPLDRVLYPYKDAWDRHATESTPAVWHGVGFHFDLATSGLTPPDMMYELLKLRLERFVILASRQLGLIGIDHIGVYNDRPVRGSSTVISAHAFGQAIDLSGFWFKDGAHVRVSDHANPKVAKRLAPIESLLKKCFDIVVDWAEDPKRHGTHFHAEVRGPRTFPSRASS